MTNSATPPREFDLQPHPRILPMLGEINLDQLHCLAELVDNSVDGFLNSARAGVSLESPEVHISLPATDSANAKLTVRDNGPGMDPNTLENSVRAGWTGNDPLSNLGMFGMGFNIATARMGTLTRVWTTRDGDREWAGLEVDFDRLMQQRHFKTPMLTRPKRDLHEHGTEVSIERLKPEQRLWFSKAGNQSKLKKELGRIYSSMLRPNGAPIAFRLMVNGTLVKRRDHCVWGGDGNPQRTVRTARYGTIDAYQQINARLADRPFCVKCWQWLPSGENKCPACDSAENVVVRQRRVSGWFGIQRYLSANDYGIDFLRHGRKIEMANKDLFFWNNGDAVEEEYPIDDPRHRGRMVGEVHLDHCRVNYTKDRFDRNDPAWDEMLELVRGLGPLRPDKAGQLGFGPNNSPLFLLFQAFRRSSPKPKSAGAYANLLIVPENDRAEEMAKRYYAGESEYQTDAKWWELVEEADREALVGNPPPPGGPDIDGFPLPPGPQPPETPPQPGPELRRTAVPSLTREYRDDRTNFRWDVRAYEVEPSDPEISGDNTPWRLKKTTFGTDEFYVDVNHPVFRSATLTPLDALLAELSWSSMDLQRGSAAPTTFASVLSALRDKYAGKSKLDPVILSGDATSTVTSIARSLSSNVDPEDSLALFNELSPAERESILGKMATRSVRNPQQAISEGRFLEFAPRKTLLTFVQNHPELFFDGKYWDAAYSSLDYGLASATEDAQAQVVRYYSALLMDAIWLAEQDPADLGVASRARLLRAALALELLAGNAAAESDS